MRKMMMPILFLATAGVFQPVSQAQNPDKTAAEENAKKQDKIAAEESARKQNRMGSPVKLQIVFAEYEGEKKVKSLPYTISFDAMRSPDIFNQWAKMRTGSRVPVSTGKDQMTYIDVGTSIDSRAVRIDDGRYSVQLNIERSWVDSEVAVPQKSANSSDPSPCQSKEPVIRQFKSEFNNTVREGETVESTLATDPLTGKVTKVQFTLTTVK